MCNVPVPHYHLDETSVILGGRGRGLESLLILSHFSIRFFKADSIAREGAPRSAVSHLGL